MPSCRSATTRAPTWRAYGFVQETLVVDGNREDNGRIGAGGSYRLTERLRVDAEVSDGDLGAGGRLGTQLSCSPTARAST